MGNDADRRIEAIAARQHSVFARFQALATGLTKAQVDYRLQSGRWIDLGPGFYAISGAALGWESNAMGALLLSPPGSALSRRSAARLYLVSDYSGRPEVVVPQGTHRGKYCVGSAVEVGPRDVRRFGPLRATSPPRTLVDLAGIATPTELESALDEFVALRLISVAAVASYIADRRLEHRPGAGRLRELLDDRRKGIPQKELERRFLRLVKKYRLPAPIRQKPSGPSKIDFAYPELMIAIEVDGWNSHGTPRALDSDLHRQNRLVLRGWTILRFTWKHVTEQPDIVAAEIREALVRRSAQIRS
jgi:very-short-patch-repair endonuclease